MTADDEDTIMPMKDVTAKPRGMVKNCDHSASLGFLAKRAKSGSFTYRHRSVNAEYHPISVETYDQSCEIRN